jgi:hypothetical protein
MFPRIEGTLGSLQQNVKTSSQTKTTQIPIREKYTISLKYRVHTPSSAANYKLL